MPRRGSGGPQRHITKHVARMLLRSPRATCIDANGYVKKNMEYVDFTSKLLPILSSALTGGFVLWGAISLLYSSPALRKTIWWERLMGRKLEVADKVLAEAIREQSELESVRIFFGGYKFRSIYHARKGIEWCSKNEIGFDELRGLHRFVIECNGAVQLSTLKFGFDGWKYVFAYLLFTLTAVSALFTVGEMQKNSEIPAFIKGSHTPIWVGKDKISSWNLIPFTRNWELDKNACDQVENLSIIESYAKILCEALKEDDQAGYVNKHLKENKIFFTLIALVFGCLSLSCWAKGYKYARAVDLNRRINLLNSRRELAKKKAEEQGIVSSPET